MLAPDMLANRTCRIEEQGGPDCENAREETKKITRTEDTNCATLVPRRSFFLFSQLMIQDETNGVLVTVLSKDAGVGYHHFDQLRGRINYEGV